MRKKQALHISCETELVLHHSAIRFRVLLRGLATNSILVVRQLFLDSSELSEIRGVPDTNSNYTVYNDNNARLFAPRSVCL
jgi:hypothetical protein